jgi:hypothetical protein
VDARLELNFAPAMTTKRLEPNFARAMTTKQLNPVEVIANA